jgi:putative transposase
MLELLIVIGRALALALRGHRELVLENLALRQQLTVMRRTTNRPHLATCDRLFWMGLGRIWPNWRTALVLVQPDTVVRWHRDWLRRRWTRRSKPRPDGRPPINQQIRVLVREMATANPLWGAPRIHGELMTLSVDVSERSVSRLLKRHPRPFADLEDVPLESPRFSRVDETSSPSRHSLVGCCSSWSCCRITVGAWRISTSRIIRRPPGPPNK